MDRTDVETDGRGASRLSTAAAHRVGVPSSLCCRKREEMDPLRGGTEWRGFGLLCRPSEAAAFRPAPPEQVSRRGRARSLARTAWSPAPVMSLAAAARRPPLRSRQLTGSVSFRPCFYRRDGRKLHCGGGAAETGQLAVALKGLGMHVPRMLACPSQRVSPAPRDRRGSRGNDHDRENAAERQQSAQRQQPA